MPGFASIPGSPHVPPHGPPGHKTGGVGPTTQVQQGEFWATAYSPPFGRTSINGTGVTKDGTDLRTPGDHYVIAAGPGSGLSMGEVVYITPNPYNNNGIGFRVADTGGMIAGKHIDIFVPDHATAMSWGRKRVKVALTGKAAEGKPTGSIVPNPFKAVGDFLGALSVIFHGGFWLRVGLVLAGFLLLGFGVTMIGKQYTVPAMVGKAIGGKK